MARIILSSLLAFGLAAAATATPATAAAAAGPQQYRAELATPAAKPKLVARDIVWRCAGDACVAPQGNSRPASDCAALADKVGALRSFSVAGEALDAAALEKCNARAR